jgi:hypothetical protein
VIYTAARIRREARRSASCVGFRNLFKHRQFSVRQRFQAISKWKQRVVRFNALLRSAVPIWRQRVFHCKANRVRDGYMRMVFVHKQSYVREKFQVALDRIGSEVLRTYGKVPARRRVQALQGIRIWRRQQEAHSETTLDIRTLFKHRKQTVYKAQSALRRWQRAVLLMTCTILFGKLLSQCDEHERQWVEYVGRFIRKQPRTGRLTRHMMGYIQQRGRKAMQSLGLWNETFRGSSSAIEQFKKNYSEADRDERWDRYLEWKAKELEQKYL